MTSFSLDLSTPKIKITSLHVQGLGPIESLKLPQGKAWGSLPDMVLLHGPNGSGKTMLMDFLAQVAACMTVRTWPAAMSPREDSWVEFKVCGDPGGQENVQFRIGAPGFITANLQAPSYGVTFNDDPAVKVLAISDRSEWVKTLRKAFPSATLYPNMPYVAYFPSERSFSIPRATQRMAGDLEEPLPFFHRWQPPRTWQQSLEAQLYSARWHDLNAQAEGREEDATQLGRFTSAFETITQGRKRLVWVRGQLYVELVSTGHRHELGQLSAGELQMMVFSAELRRWWRPGSLILIDEPELHLHTSWQLRLLELLRQWQSELGGQVILSSLSDTLAGAMPAEALISLGR